MKKAYIKPTTEVVNINVENLIMSSGRGITFDDSNDTGRGFLEDEDASGALISPRMLFFD